MKKRLIKVILVLIILVVTGCSNGIFGNSNIEKIDSKVDYIIFRNKKIYLTENLEDMVLQFKGLGCVFKKTFGNGVKIEIDKINSKDNEFYSLAGSDNMFDIECPTDDITYTMDVTLMLKSGSVEEEQKKYADRELKYWNIFSIEENVKISVDKKILSIGNYNGATVSKLKDVVNILGNNYEVDEYYDDVIYNIGGYEYTFDVSTGSEEINGITIEKK